MGKGDNGGGHQDGLSALAGLVRARRELEEAERHLRVRLLAEGVSLARIGKVYGISRQAARTRFRADVPPAPRGAPRG